MRKIVSMGLFVAFVAATAAAQAPAGCSGGDKAKQFDFWIGHWRVTSDGNLAGTNRIEPILDGCVLQETWAGTSGGSGSSFNFYNPLKKKWQQFWVWRNGTTLEVEGEYADGKMVLAGKSLDKDRNTVHNRITWYDNEDGTVRQYWETSKDGKTWSAAFDGLYTKMKEEPSTKPATKPATRSATKPAK